MKSKLLFDDGSDFRPGKQLSEPAIWVRWLGVLERLEEGLTPIREVEFRRGLNIIATAIPRPGETESVGHNMGKTLLTRLVRYCLGEQYYGKQSVRTAVGRAFPDGYVVAEIIVGGKLWTVARPLGPADRPKQFAWEGIGRKEIFAASESHLFNDFLEELEVATVRRFAGVTLPGQKRAAMWRDVLSWITRDQHCAYRDPLEWRSPWTESGSAELDAEDSSLIVRLAMDMVDTAEGELIRKRKRLLERKKQVTELHQAMSTRLARNRQFLHSRLNMPEDLLEGGLFEVAASKQLTDGIASARADIDKLPIDSGLAALTERLAKANQDLLAIQENIRLRKEDREDEEKNLKKNRAASTKELMDDIGDALFNCPAKYRECPLHKSTGETTERPEYRELLVRESTRRLAQLDQDLAQLRGLRSSKKKQRDRIQRQVEPLAKKIGKRMDKLKRRLSVLEVIEEELSNYKPLRDEVESLAKRVVRLDKKIESLREEQRVLAERNTKKLKQLNESVSVVQRIILGREADRSIRIGLNRLTFSGVDEEPSPGEGMATSATLSLDLACLRAGLEGLGFLPRFLIHDSPRGGDLEAHLYAHLFSFAVALESAFQEPPFQYILATTTQPPRELLKKPYLKLTLDARDPKELLLRRRF